MIAMVPNLDTYDTDKARLSILLNWFKSYHKNVLIDTPVEQMNIYANKNALHNYVIVLVVLKSKLTVWVSELETRLFED